MMIRIKLILIIVTIALLTAVPLLAQEETLPTGEVTGQISNLTPNGMVPDGLELMLHAWDRDFNEQLMLAGQADAAGTFQFDEVIFNPDWFYAVMLTYDDVLYFSEPTPLTDGETMLTIDVAIYDKTSETTAVQVDRQHVFFDADPGGLLVGEVYILSNLGERTIAGDNGDSVEIAPLQFSLPDEATNVTFEGSENGRFLFKPGGFVDTAPLRPGTGTGQVVVRYVLPYKDGMAYTMTPKWPTNGVNFLVPEGTSITLAGDGLTAEGTRDIGNGRLVTMFSHTEMQADDALDLTISGDLAVPEPAVSMSVEDNTAPMPESTNKALAIGGIILGLILIGVGIWWYRRPVQEVDEGDLTESDVNFDDLVLQIARLDEVYDQGGIDEALYTQQRAALRQQAQGVLPLVEAK